jgi:hypothetical protein
MTECQDMGFTDPDYIPVVPAKIKKKRLVDMEYYSSIYWVAVHKFV